MSLWIQPVCEPCYGVMFPNVEPKRLPMEDFPDHCAVCGRETYAGIWLEPASTRDIPTINDKEDT